MLLCSSLKGTYRCFLRAFLKAEAWAPLFRTPPLPGHLLLILRLCWVIVPLGDTSGKPFWTRVGHPKSPCPSPSQYPPKWQLNNNLYNHLFNLYITGKLYVLREQGLCPPCSWLHIHSLTQDWYRRVTKITMKDKMERVNGWNQVHSPNDSPTYWSPLQVDRATLESLIPLMFPW